jgi:hypothetical protein
MSAKGQKRTYSCSFNHLVGAQKERLRNFEVERLNGREIDDKLEFGRRLYRKIGRLVAAQDTVDVGRQRLCMGTGLGVTIVDANMRSTTASWRRWDGAESTRKR